MLNTLIKNNELVSVESQSLIIRYYDLLKSLFSNMEDERRSNPSSNFEPPFELPELTEDYVKFFDVARVSFEDMGVYEGKKIHLLNLIKNPGTQTTKTLASLLMVARAVNHINKTGKGILIFTPSSGNKAIALRDAVERAIQFNLVDRKLLRIITLTPAGATHKLRDTTLTIDSELRELNPVFSYKGESAQDVKVIGKEFIENYGKLIEEEYGLNIWYSLDIRNYKVADSLRAFYDHEFFTQQKDFGKRIHAHAVSSAYGLLGYNFGQEFLEQNGISNIDKPGYLLVQHASTSDMVLNLLYNSFSEDNAPIYTKGEDGLYTQCQSENFPYKTWNPKENLEHTFYTHQPPTSPEMNNIIKNNGGNGIVVSLYECMTRYGKIKEMLKNTDINIPEDPRDVNEWSLIMAITGVLNAIDRGLLNDFEDVVIHGSGIYCKGDYTMLPQNKFYEITTAQEVFNNFNR